MAEEKKKNTWGGAREGAGRPKKESTPTPPDSVGQNGSGVSPEEEVSPYIQGYLECPHCTVHHKGVCVVKNNPCACDSCKNGKKMSLAELVEEFEKYRYLYDREALEIACASMIANFIGDAYPVWLLLIGRSSGGKTQFLELFRNHDKTQFESKMTGKTMFSGLEGAKDKIFEFNDKIVIIKDLAPMQAGKNEDLKEIVLVLRDAYDGEGDWAWGSKKADVHWEGKFGLVAASTTAIDIDMWKFKALGERYIRVDLTDNDEIEDNLADIAVHDRKGIRAGKALRLAGCAFLNKYIPEAEKFHADNLIEISEEKLEQIKLMCQAGALLRTAVNTSGEKKTILPTEPEASPRLIHQIRTLCEGLAIINDRDHVNEHDIQLALRVSYDGIPTRRRKVVKALLAGLSGTNEIASFIGSNSTTTSRELQELQEINAVNKVGGKWELRERVEEWIEMSGLVRRIMATDLTKLEPKAVRDEVA